MLKTISYNKIPYISLIYLVCIIQTIHAEETSKRILFINKALSYLGTPYKYACASNDGMDCSGLIYKSALEAINISLPRKASSISTYAKKIDTSKLQAGDLVFFNTFGSGVSHVGIFLGDDKFIHSASDGSKTGVIISSLKEKYWEKAYLCAGRILPPEEDFSFLYETLNKQKSKYIT